MLVGSGGGQKQFCGLRDGNLVRGCKARKVGVVPVGRLGRAENQKDE